LWQAPAVLIAFVTESFFAARRFAAPLVCAAAVLATSLASVANAASLPAVIAYEGSTGIGTVQPGHVHSTRLLYAPRAGGTDAPAWSPNGETLAFGVNTPHGLGIGLVDREGSLVAANQLPHLPGPADVAWSPNGKEIAYLCLDGPLLTTPSASPFVPPNQFFNVCVLDVVTGAHRLLAASTLAEGISCCASPGRISWSRTDDVIAVGGERDIAPGNCINFGCGQPDIALIDVADGKIAALDGTDNYGEPAFSPDGREIAATNFATRGGVYIMSASGAHARRIVPPSDRGAEPNWSPNGKELVFETSTGDLATVDTDGGNLKPATRILSGAPSWVGPLTRCTVPKLKGQTLAAAKRLVALAGCVFGKVTGPKSNRSKRHVVNQKPAANHNVATGTKVDVQLR
jgi:dipeptidyl aminopeptidase/acylaminoacyl peptidase